MTREADLFARLLASLEELADRVDWCRGVLIEQKVYKSDFGMLNTVEARKVIDEAKGGRS